VKYKDWLKFFRKFPHKDLNGKFIAYDIDGRPLGEVVYKNGKVVSKRIYTNGSGERREINNKFKNYF
jgi:hypothetical protein